MSGGLTEPILFGVHPANGSGVAGRRASGYEEAIKVSEQLAFGNPPTHRYNLTRSFYQTWSQASGHPDSEISGPLTSSPQPRTVIFSIKNDGGPNWDQLANAGPGSDSINSVLNTWASGTRKMYEVLAPGRVCYFTFWHEPNGPTDWPSRAPSASNFAEAGVVWQNAFKYIRDYWVNNGLVDPTYVKFGPIWVPDHYESSDVMSWWPDWSDYVGVDPYNWSFCKVQSPAPAECPAQSDTESASRFLSFDEKSGPTFDFAHGTGPDQAGHLPVLVAEYGTPEADGYDAIANNRCLGARLAEQGCHFDSNVLDPVEDAFFNAHPNWKAQWFDDMWNNLYHPDTGQHKYRDHTIGLSYWDTPNDYPFWIETRPQSLSAFGNFGRNILELDRGGVTPTPTGGQVGHLPM